MPEWVPINWRIAGNPLNWVIVLLMVLIGAAGIDIVLGATVGGGITLPTLPFTSGGSTVKQ